MNKQFSDKDTQMLKLISNQEMQIKLRRYHFTESEWQKIFTSDTIKCH